MNGRLADKAATEATQREKRIAAKRRKRRIKALCFALLVPFRGYFLSFFALFAFFVVNATAEFRINRKEHKDRIERNW